MGAALLGVAELAAAGVTVITHGFNGNVQGWVSGMANRISRHPQFPGTNILCYEMAVTDNGGLGVTSRKVAGGNPTNDPTAEIVIKLDWSELAGLFAQYDTYEVAAAVVPKFLQTNFIAELGGHALAELPLHLVGHSRGGSLVCQMSLLLGTNGVWVDHLTTLDPHPVNEDGNTDPLLVSDAPLRIYENVLFADNYYQEFGGYPHGQLLSSSYNRRFTALPGGYSSAHSDTHLWYHGTIDLREPASDSETQLSASDRTTWFASYELRGARAGLHYSLLGGGDRLSLDEPAGPGADRPADGYNQRWNLGAGTSANRTALPANSGAWPNPIRFSLTGTNLVAQGNSNTVALHYQWARPPGGIATVGIYLDDNLNPWDGNERLVGLTTVNSTTATNIAGVPIAFLLSTANSIPGTHFLSARISDGSRVRCAYASETITVVSGFAPPVLTIERAASNRVRVDINGNVGQRIVLQSTSDFQTWQPLATNWLTPSTWSYLDPAPDPSRRFFRATLR